MAIYGSGDRSTFPINIYNVLHSGNNFNYTTSAFVLRQKNAYRSAHVKTF